MYKILAVTLNKRVSRSKLVLGDAFCEENIEEGGEFEEGCRIVRMEGIRCYGRRGLEFT